MCIQKKDIRTCKQTIKHDSKLRFVVKARALAACTNMVVWVSCYIYHAYIFASGKLSAECVSFYFSIQMYDSENKKKIPSQAN